jgi:hypothetical protein
MFRQSEFWIVDADSARRTGRLVTEPLVNTILVKNMSTEQRLLKRRRRHVIITDGTLMNET